MKCVFAVDGSATHVPRSDANSRIQFVDATARIQQVQDAEAEHEAAGIVLGAEAEHVAEAEADTELAGADAEVEHAAEEATAHVAEAALECAAKEQAKQQESECAAEADAVRVAEEETAAATQAAEGKAKFCVREGWKIKLTDLEIGNKLGHGAYGDVFEASLSMEHNESKKVAFKRFHSKKGAASLLNREARNLAAARHPNVIGFLGVCVDNDMGLVMELATKGSLREIISSAPTLSDDQLLTLSTGISTGLEFLHSNTPTAIIHRDLKTANVLVAADGTPKIADFGMVISTSISVSQTTARGGGTPAYLAPEMWVEDGSDDSDDSDGGGGAGGGRAPECTPKCDVYAFGMVLYAMVSGKEPWADLCEKTDPHLVPLKIRKKVLKSKRPPMEFGTSPTVGILAELLQRCWVQSPTERPSMQEAKRELVQKYKQHEHAESHCCVICEDAQKSVLLQPCKHICMCKDCSQKVAECPVCREKIESRITGVHYVN
jgi:tRNA A-37 threonylcarbamoyl transferase component Bud32